MKYNAEHAPVAQLDRVLGYEPRGRAFESLRAHQIPAIKTKAYSLTTVSLLSFYIPRPNLVLKRLFTDKGYRRIKALLTLYFDSF